ncbi:hypothetical protein [Bhargavaea ginsengi]|uniref:hypothetical protein n=1 Tax=Bhargavaea ginsengi TaxID=426757 RepID=UPI003C72A7FD
MKRNLIIRLLRQIGRMNEQLSRRSQREETGEWINQGDDWEEDWVWVDSDKSKWLYRICYINIHKREDGHDLIISWERDPDADHVHEFAYRHIDQEVYIWSKYYCGKGKITLIREVEDKKWEGNAWL